MVASTDQSWTNNGWFTGRDEETLESDLCSWFISRGCSDYGAWGEWQTYRSMEVGSQVLFVPPALAWWVCAEVDAREAELDGVAYLVDLDTWVPVTDADGDGVSQAADCDDADPDVAPCTEDPSCDGLDQDCDGEDHDQDGDGYLADCAGGDDCDDADASVYPGVYDEPRDERDANCDGYDGRPPTVKDTASTAEEAPAAGQANHCGQGCAWLILPFPLVRVRRRSRR